MSHFIKYLKNDRATFLGSITIPVEKVVIIIIPHAMVLAPKIEYFVVINVYLKTAGKTYFQQTIRMLRKIPTELRSNTLALISSYLYPTRLHN